MKYITISNLDFYENNNALEGNRVYLLQRTDWNDNGYYTEYTAYYFDNDRKCTLIGNINIINSKMPSEKVYEEHGNFNYRDINTYLKYGTCFKSLNDLVKSENYIFKDTEFYTSWKTSIDYRRAYEIGKANGFNIFEDLNDIAYSKKFKGYREKDVCKMTIFRYYDYNKNEDIKLMYDKYDFYNKISIGEYSFKEDIRYLVLKYDEYNKLTNEPYFYYNHIYLVINDRWNDYSYVTSFDVYCFGERIGMIRIAKSGMTKEECKTETYLKTGMTFKNLSELGGKLGYEFYSAWGDSSKYYEDAYKLGKVYKFNIFEDLNDIAYDLKKLTKYQKEDVCENSILRHDRYPSYDSIKYVYAGQYHRIVRGEEKFRGFEFLYKREDENFVIDFKVNPGSNLPTNIHVLIGSNGTGKTTIIKNMIKSFSYQFLNKKLGEHKGDFECKFDEKDIDYEYIVNIMCISFNPFDDYEGIDNIESENISFIGYKKSYQNQLDLLKNINTEFINSFSLCKKRDDAKDDMKEILDRLSKEIVFINYKNDINNMKDLLDKDDDNNKEISDIFENMSAGFKVVLSILTGCVSRLREYTLVFIDEPENHLHPPLLSTLIRVLSDELRKRNGVCIISTHSPIVVQEVPSTCVWKLSRSGSLYYARRVDEETFGTNIGVLTDSIFGFEIAKTGFNKLVEEAMNDCNSLDEVVAKFEGHLGDQAKAIAMMILYRKRNSSEEN